MEVTQEELIALIEEADRKSQAHAINAWRLRQFLGRSVWRDSDGWPEILKIV